MFVAMPDFFNGWRRKAGCIALVIALALTGAWIRSLYFRDEVYEASTYRAFRSYNGGLGFQMVKPFRRVLYEDDGWVWRAHFGRDFEEPDPGWGIGTGDTHWFTFEMYKQEAIDWHWRSDGFEFGTATIGYDPSEDPILHVWIIPYWSLTLPPTLLAAYLILFPGRPMKKPAY